MKKVVGAFERVSDASGAVRAIRTAGFLASDVELVVQRGKPGAILDATQARVLGEEADVVGQRTGEQLVVLHDDADHPADRDGRVPRCRRVGCR